MTDRPPFSGPPLRLREFLLALAGFLAVTALYWWPMLREPGAVYSTGRDWFQNTWNLWWVRHAWEQGLPFLWTDRLFAPTGTSLAFHTISFANSIPALFLLDSLSLETAHHLLFVSSFLFSALGAWALVRCVTGSPWGAFLGGLYYSFHPYHTAMVTQLNNAQFQWLPLFLLAFLFLMRSGRTPWILWSGLFLALCGYADWYQPFFAGLAALVLLAVHLRQRGGGRRPAFWGRLLTAGGLGLLLMLPGLWPLIREMAQLGGGAELEEPIRYVGEMQLLGVRPNGSPAFHFWPVVLGWSVCLLLAWGALRVRDREVRAWWWLLGVAFLFLQGPWLVVLDRHLNWLPLPMALFPHVPGLSMIRVPHRFLILLVLALAVLSGFALRVLLERAREPRRVLLTGLAAVALVATELRPAPRRPVDLQPAEIYASLAQDPGDYSVLELPLDFRDGYVMWLQTRHGKRLPHGYTSHIHPEALVHLRSELMRALMPVDPDTDIPYLPEHLDLEEARGMTASELSEETAAAWRRELEEDLGVRVILFHEEADFPPPAGLPALPESPGLVDKLRIALLPFCLNPFTRDNEVWRQVAARRFTESLAAKSAQARALIERLYGPPDDVQGVHGRTLVWDLRRR